MRKKKLCIISLLLILSIVFAGCFGGLSKEKFLKIQDTFYNKLFMPYIFDKIDSGDYYSDIQYKIDSLMSETNERIGGTPFYDSYLSLDGGMYKDTWIFYVEYDGYVYGLCWLEVKYSSNMKASSRRANIYKYSDEINIY